MKTKTLLIALFIINAFLISAQTTDEVTLVVSADGATKEEAIKVALRSAIEQAYGTFVSANTTILNDDMVKDEIVTVTSGNIKNYDEISAITLNNNMQRVTLKTTVCISKLVSYAQSKGASTEFAGATFGMNIKMYELNKKNEKAALKNLLTQLEEFIPSCFETKLSIGDPQIVGDNCILPLSISYIPNDNYKSLYHMVVSTLEGISIKEGQISKREDVSAIMWKKPGNWNNKFILHFRNGDWINDCFCISFNYILLNYFCGFNIIDNTGQTSSLKFDQNFTLEKRMEKDGSGMCRGTGILSNYRFCNITTMRNSYLWPNTYEWYSEINLNSMQFFDKNNEKYHWKQMVKESTLEIECTIPISDISKYSNFTIRH